MARGEQVRAFAARHGLPVLSVEDVVAYRLSRKPAADGKPRSGVAAPQDEGARIRDLAP